MLGAYGERAGVVLRVFPEWCAGHHRYPRGERPVPQGVAGRDGGRRHRHLIAAGLREVGGAGRARAGLIRSGGGAAGARCTARSWFARWRRNERCARSFVRSLSSRSRSWRTSSPEPAEIRRAQLESASPRSSRTSRHDSSMRPRVARSATAFDVGQVHRERRRKVVDGQRKVVPVIGVVTDEAVDAVVDRSPRARARPRSPRRRARRGRRSARRRVRAAGQATDASRLAPRPAARGCPARPTWRHRGC